MAERFDLHCTGPDGAKHRPVTVHRSVIGSLERAVAHLIEVHGGAFPAWPAPTQLVALPVSDAEADGAAGWCAAAATGGSGPSSPPRTRAPWVPGCAPPASSRTRR
ncbi:hypothetical protein [Streptomyces sp. NPDC058255]|uniref:hypothetical protein n=1 Tax=Streptomyces sp. NPDC058255 TaxID=3346407 RepID=UPI0036F15185